MNFAENQQGVAILSKLRSQKSLGRFCDVTFQIGTQSYQAHRNILAACSPYFDAMLSNTVYENIIVNCTNHSAFVTLLDYIYSGKVDILHENVHDLMLLANQYMMSKLKSYCCEFLEKNMTLDRCYSVKFLAEACDLPGLHKVAESFILSNLAEVWKQEEVLKFTKEQLDGIISNKTLPVMESLKFNLICNWVKFEVSERQSYLRLFLEKLTWKALPLVDVYNLLQDSALFRDNDQCMLQLLEVLESHGQLFDIYRDTLQHLRNKMNADNHNSIAYGGNVSVEVRHSLPVSEKLCFSEEDQSTELGTESIGLDDFDDEDYMSGSFTDEDTSSKDEEYKICSTNKPVSPPSSPVSGVTTRSRRKKATPLKITQGNKAINVANQPQTKKTRSATKRKHAGKSQSFRSKRSCGKSQETRLSRKPRESKPLYKKEHAIKSDSSQTVHCPLCSFTTTVEEKLENHITRSHKDNFTYECNICEFSSTWIRDYTCHMKQHFDGSPYKCDAEGCSFSCERLQMFLFHRMKHTDQRPYVCSKCNKKFRYKSNLRAHSRCHTGDKPFKCDDCGRSFATKGTLEQHSVTHSDVRPYLCDSCGFSTKYQSHLVAHRRIHTGDVFKCQFKDCKYETPKRSQLSCHMRTHMSIRSHTCSACGRSFVEKSHLVRHERIHLTDKPFKCDTCSYSTARRDKLKEHEAKHHNAEPKPTTKTKTKPVTAKSDVPEAQKVRSAKIDTVTESPVVQNQQNLLSSTGVGLQLPHIPQTPLPQSSTNQQPDTAVLSMLTSVISHDSFTKQMFPVVSTLPQETIPSLTLNQSRSSMDNQLPLMFETSSGSPGTHLENLANASLPIRETFEPHSPSSHPQNSSSQATITNREFVNLQSYINSLPGFFNQ